MSGTAPTAGPSTDPHPTSRLEEAPAMSVPTPGPDRSVKVPHLVMALLFLGTAAGWALVVTGFLTPSALPYALPGLLVAAGVIGLVAVAVGGRRAPARTTPHPARHHEPVTMDDSSRDDHADDPADKTDDLEHTAPLHRPEDHR